MYATRSLVVAAMQGKAEEAFNGYMKAMYPWLEDQQGQDQKKIMELMQKWTAQGPISFKPIATRTPLHNRMRDVKVGDDFRRKLQEKAKRGPRR